MPRPGAWGSGGSGKPGVGGGSVERLAALDFFEVPRDCLLGPPLPCPWAGLLLSLPMSLARCHLPRQPGPNRCSWHLIHPFPAVIAQGPHRQLVLFYAEPDFLPLL